MLSEKELKDVKAAARERLRTVPGVVGFGIGNGTLIIYTTDASVADRLPKVFEGVEVELIVTGKVVAY